MTLAVPITEPPHEYPSLAAWCADLIVHVVGLTLALVGGVVLLALAVRAGSFTAVVGVSVYAVGLLAMLAFSMAYNFASPRLQPMMRRLDHAGIFLMIAGSYTPFTIHNLTGAWAWGLTATVWTIAGGGVVAMLLAPRVDRRFSVTAYMALGWLVLVALKPMIDNVAWGALLLLLAGGVVYSTGVIFHVKRHLKFSRAIWHGHVVAGAATHWAAVLLGVVLAAHT